ncbi:DCC1-like thiol-disulfide oxidoreductase family protein [Salinarchaeum chitinilyticum]
MDTPTLVFDDDCGFCTYWVELVAERSDLAIVGFSELSGELREQLPEDYEECAHLLADGEIYSCGAAMEEAFLRAEMGGPLADVARFGRGFEEYDRLREAAYRWVADNRDLLGKVVSRPPPARDRS